MPQSLSRILVHLVCSTKNREPWLDDDLRPRAFAYLAEVGRDHDCEVYRVGGMPDHVHLAVQLGRTISVAWDADRVRARKPGTAGMKRPLGTPRLTAP